MGCTGSKVAVPDSPALSESTSSNRLERSHTIQDCDSGVVTCEDVSVADIIQSGPERHLLSEKRKQSHEPLLQHFSTFSLRRRLTLKKRRKEECKAKEDFRVFFHDWAVSESMPGVTAEVLTAALKRSQQMRWAEEFLILYRCTYDTIKEMATSELGDSCEQLLLIMQNFLHIVLAELTLYVHDPGTKPSFARKLQDAIMSSAELIDTFKKTSFKRRSKNRSGEDVFVNFVKDRLRETQRSSQRIMTELGYLEKFQISECFSVAAAHSTEAPTGESSPIGRCLVNSVDEGDCPLLGRGHFTDNTRIRVMRDITKWYHRRWDLSCQRVYILTGSATSGKSTVAKEVCKRFSDTLLCSYFMERQQVSAPTGKAFVIELARCLCTKLCGYLDKLPTSESFRNAVTIGDFNFVYQCLVTDTLSTLKKYPKRMLIVLDGLQNCSESDQRNLVEFIRHFNEETPHWLYLFVSVRDTGYVHDNLNFHLLKRYNLDEMENNRDDIRVYLSELVGERSQTLRETIENIADMSDGSFVYAVHMAEKLENGNVHDVAMDEIGETFLAAFIPTSLEELYHIDMVDLKNKLKSYDSYNRVLAPLLVARQPLHQSLLHQFLKDDEYNCILDMHTYFELDSDSGNFRICHTHLIDWFESLENDNECYVDLTSGHSTLAEVCQRFLSDTTLNHDRYKLIHTYAMENILYHLHYHDNKLKSLNLLCDIKFIASRLMRTSNTFQCWYNLTTEMCALQLILQRYYAEQKTLDGNTEQCPMLVGIHRLKQYYDFLVVQAPSLIRHPELTLQYAHNALSHPLVASDAKKHVHRCLRSGWLNVIMDPAQTRRQRQNMFFKNKLRAVDVSPDETLISCVTSHCDEDGDSELQLHIIDADSFSLIQTIDLEPNAATPPSNHPSGLLYHCKFFHDGEHIFYGSLDEIAHINGSLVKYTLDGCDAYFCTSCDVSTKRKVLAIGLAPISIAEEEDYRMANSVLHVYDIERNEFIVSLDKYDGYITCIAFDTYGQWFAFFTSGSRRICIWNLEKMSMEKCMPIPVKEAVSIHFPLPNIIFMQTQETHIQKIVRCDIIKEEITLVKTYQNNSPLSSFADQRCVYTIFSSTDPWLCHTVIISAFNKKTLLRDARDSFEMIPFLTVNDKQTLQLKCSASRIVFTAGITLASCKTDDFLNNTFSDLTQNYQPIDIVFDSTFSADNELVIQKIDFCSGRVCVSVFGSTCLEPSNCVKDILGRKQRGPIFALPPVMSSHNAHGLLDCGSEFHGASDVRLWNKQTNQTDLISTNIEKQSHCPGENYRQTSHRYRVTSMCFSNHDAYIIIGGKFTQSEFIDVFSTETLERLHRYEDRGCFLLPYKNDSASVMSCNNSGKMFMWSHCEKGSLVEIEILSKGYLNRDEFLPPVTFSSDSSKMVMLQISCESIRIHLIDVENKHVHILDEQEDKLYEFLYPYPFMTGFSPSGHVLATSLNSNVIRMFNALNGMHVKDISSLQGCVVSGGWCTDRHLAVISSENEFTALHIIDTHTESELNYMPLKGFSKLYFSNCLRQPFQRNSKQPEHMAIVQGDIGVTLISPQYKHADAHPRIIHSSARSLVVKRSSKGSILSMESIV